MGNNINIIKDPTDVFNFSGRRALLLAYIDGQLNVVTIDISSISIDSQTPTSWVFSTLGDGNGLERVNITDIRGEIIDAPKCKNVLRRIRNILNELG